MGGQGCLWGGLGPNRDDTQCSVQLGFSLVLFGLEPRRRRAGPAEPCPAHTQLLCKFPDTKLHSRPTSRDPGHRCASAGSPWDWPGPCTWGVYQPSPPPSGCRSFSCSVFLGWASSGRAHTYESSASVPGPLQCECRPGPSGTCHRGGAGFGDPTVHSILGRLGRPEKHRSHLAI